MITHSIDVTKHDFQILHYYLYTLVDTKRLGFASIAENMGCIVGSALCTFIFYNRGNKEMQVALSYLWLGLCVILTPHLPNVYVYYVMLFLQNIAAGNVDVFSMVNQYDFFDNFSLQ